MMAKLTDEAFESVRGTTDSECIFALILTFLSKDGESEVSPFLQTSPFGHQRLVTAIKKTLRSIEIMMDEAGLYDTTFSTFNFSLVDGDTMVVTRFCDKNPSIPPPSLYFAFGNSQRLYDELTSEEPVLSPASSSSAELSSNLESDVSVESESETETYNEKVVSLGNRESRPGRVCSDVDPETACLIVASNPLTRTHTWHRLPSNSIMWYTRGSFPELRLLRGRSQTASIIE